MKKTVVIVSVIALVAIAGIAYFLTEDYWKRQADPFEAVPSDAAVIFHMSDVSQQLTSLHKSELLPKLRNYSVVQRLEQDLIFFDTTFLASGAERYEHELVASLHKIKSNDYGILYTLKESHLNADTYAKVAKHAERTAEPRIYKDTKIYEFTGLGGKEVVAMAYRQGLVMLSEHPFLVENAIAQLDNKENAISALPGFRSVHSLAEKNDDPKIYINFDALPGFLSIYFTGTYDEGKGGIGDFTNWLLLDYAILKDNILVNGYTAVGSNSFLAKLQEKETTADPAEILPFNTAVLYSFSLAETAPQNKEYQQLYEQYFMNWMGNNIALAIVEPYSEKYKETSFLLVEAEDPEVAESLLRELSAAQFDVVRSIGEHYKGYDIYRLPEFNSLEPLLGLNSELISSPYFTVVGDYTIFANSIASIKVLLERYVEKQTLSKDLDYITFRKQMTTRPAFNVFVNTARTIQLLKASGTPFLKAYVAENFEDLKALNPVGLQFTTFKDNIYLVSGMVQSTEGFQRRTNLMWKTQLNANTTMRPKIVMNHYDQRYEILVQDVENHLYLLDNSGEILWQMELDNQIVGEIYQVDFYKNGKLQYLFTTKESVYLIDRNGDLVENFPLRMPSEVTSGLAYIDYDNNSNYRMFIGCANGNIYGFEKSGKPLSGWNPKRDIGILRGPVQHLATEGRDYLIAVNDKGKIYYFNRRGENRIPPIELKAEFLQPFSIELLPAGKFHLVNMSTDGRLFSVGHSGNYQVDSAGAFTPPVHFRYHDITGDEKREYIVMDEQQLYVNDQNRRLVFEYSLPGNIAKDIIFISYPGLVKDRIGLYSPEQKKIYLLTESGNLYEDFPLTGISPFTITDLYKTGERTVIVGAGDKTITTYRLR